MKKSKPDAVRKIVEGLIRLTTVPVEKSVIKWQMNKVFSQCCFETRYKNKIYSFDGRHLCIYPAGYELPSGVIIGFKQGPDILLHIRIDAMPRLLSELWRNICGQHEKTMQNIQSQENANVFKENLRQRMEREKVLNSANEILRDFK